MPKEFLEYLPALVVVLLLFRRTKRPRRVRPNLVWILPAILFVCGALFVVGAIQNGARLATNESLVVAGAALAGAVLGALRGHTLHLTRHPETGVIESTLSMWGLVIFSAWMVGRNILHRSDLQHAAAPFGVFNAAMLALAMASVTARAIVLFRRCAALEVNPATATIRIEAMGRGD